MSTKAKRLQNLIRLYRDETGATEVDMKDVAKFGVTKGWSLPAPINPIDRFAKELADAAREEIKYDKVTGEPYRANLAVTDITGQRHFWVDMDTAPRKHVYKSLFMRREQVVGDCLQLSFDQDHWNSIRREEAPIIIPMDFTDDVIERKHAPKKFKKAS